MHVHIAVGQYMRNVYRVNLIALMLYSDTTRQIQRILRAVKNRLVLTNAFNLSDHRLQDVGAGK